MAPLGLMPTKTSKDERLSRQFSVKRTFVGSTFARCTREFVDSHLPILEARYITRLQGPRILLLGVFKRGFRMSMATKLLLIIAAEPCVVLHGSMRLCRLREGRMKTSYWSIARGLFDALLQTPHVTSQSTSISYQGLLRKK